MERKIYFLWLLLVTFLSINDAAHFLSNAFLEKVRKKARTWNLGHNFHESISEQYLRGLMGVHVDSYKFPLPDKREVLGDSDDEISIADLPAEFDARLKWSTCPTVREVREQGSCGSCWAIAPASVMSDRICIHSRGVLNFRLSGADMLACCAICGFACRGGFPGAAWSFWTRKGMVSGGDYGSGQGCLSYNVEPCDHHRNGSRPVCTVGGGLRCQHVCVPSYPMTYNRDRNFGSKVYSIRSNPLEIQKEIMANGPVQAILTVYEDFLSYKTGVYYHLAGNKLGPHAVRILGWGVWGKKKVPYWLVANSWGSDWGDNGFFHIVRGQNHCDIEGYIMAGLPKL
ncbi:cathepsin B-like [Drosophila tropicalis]|uniref:cathepsin B-like n=1 Tax=Drosophila tropicalis TaxID=46794 RepID=UPI0035ABDF48